MDANRNNGTVKGGTPHNVPLESLSLTIIMLGSIVANTTAIVIILRTRSLRKHAHNLLILSLNIADLGVALFSMTFALVSVIDGGRFLRSSPTVCMLNGFLAVSFTFAIPPIIFFITLERFLAVNLSRRFPPNRRRVIVFIALTWSTSIMAAILPMTRAVERYRYTPNTRHCSPDFSHGLFFPAGIILLFVEIPSLLVLYSAIVWHLWTVDKNLKKTRDRNPSITPSCGESSITNYCPGDDGAVDDDDDDDVGTMPSMTSESRPREENGGIICLGKSIKSVAPVVRATSGAGDVEKKIRVKSFRLRKYGAKKRQLSKQKRVARIGALLVLSTIVCWIPYLLVHLGFLSAVVSDDHWFGVTSMWLAFTNVLLDPVIYTFMNRRARTELRSAFRWLAEVCPRTHDG